MMGESKATAMLRPCEYRTFVIRDGKCVWDKETGKCLENDPASGLFHGFFQSHEEYDSGPGPIPVALVEDERGNILELAVSKIRFTDSIYTSYFDAMSTKAEPASPDEPAAIKLGDKMRTIRRTDDPYTCAKVAKGTVFVVAGIDVDPADGDELIVYGRTVNGLWCWLRPADLEVVKEDGE